MKSPYSSIILSGRIQADRANKPVLHLSVRVGFKTWKKSPFFKKMSKFESIAAKVKDRQFLNSI